MWINILRFFTILILDFVEAGLSERHPRITEHPSNWTVPKNDPVTLKCSAEGHPEPIIHWYKDGERIQSSAHKVHLPTGALFFLKVSHSKKDSDAGTYWCEATNRLGRARSKDAYLKIAFLREDFRVSPVGGRVIAGEKVELECSPPRGSPSPEVSWAKDGNPIALNYRVYQTDGRLIIRKTLQTDEGRYTCLATNVVGTRTSKPTVLAVLVRPFFVKLPNDVIGKVGAKATLQCRAGGVPSPSVLWRRHDGRMPLGRAHLADDDALVITSLSVDDSGVYICQAENEVDIVVANATLTVRDPPRLENGPEDSVVLVNQRISLPCQGLGAPSPISLWTIAGEPQPLGVGWQDERARIANDGSLELEPASEDMGGAYTCLLLSVSGSVRSSAWLTVVNPQHTPPPSFTVKPTNQTLPEGAPAVIYCRAKGPPAPTVTWWKDNSPFIADDKRMRVSPEGDLYFTGLNKSDSGKYTCVASSSSGESQHSAVLQVIHPQSLYKDKIVVPAPKPSVLPKAPSRPRINQLTNTSVTISWSPKERRRSVSVASILSYAIERSADGSSWEIVADSVNSESYTAKIMPGVTYVFTVRANNAYGQSAPSAWAPLVVGGSSWTELPMRNNWDHLELNLTSVIPMSSTSLKVTWEVSTGGLYLDGLYVHYRPKRPETERARHLISSDANYPTLTEYIPWETITVLNAGASSYILTNLEAHTYYEIFLVPFIRIQSGVPSQLLHNITHEGAPDGPPTHVSVEYLNSTSCLLRWKPPTLESTNGPIIKYQIAVYANETTLYTNKTVNATVLSYVISNLRPGQSYAIRISAVSRKGIGPASSAVRHRNENRLNPLANRHAESPGSVKEAWIIVLIGGLTFIFLFALVIFLYVRRVQNKSSKLPTLNGSGTKTSNLANFYGGENLWPENGWSHDDDMKSETKTFSTTSRGATNILNVAPEYAEIDTFGTFAGSRHIAGRSDSKTEPYATASILRSKNPVPNGAIQQQIKERTRMSQEFLNNTDCKDKQLTDSKRPFFIETSSGMSAYSGINPAMQRGNTTANISAYAKKAASPYSINTFASQPHLIGKGLTLTLENFIPPPPNHPPPNQSRFKTSKTMEELPYACYSSTQIASPNLVRACSAEGRLSPCTVSSATYQSIDGLTDIRQERCRSRCGNCGSRTSTLSRKRLSKSHHYYRPNYYDESLYRHKPFSCHTHLSSTCYRAEDPPTCAPNFYGWSPPRSPNEFEGFYESRSGYWSKDSQSKDICDSATPAVENNIVEDTQSNLNVQCESNESDNINDSDEQLVKSVDKLDALIQPDIDRQTKL